MTTKTFMHVQALSIKHYRQVHKELTIQEATLIWINKYAKSLRNWFEFWSIN